MLHPSSYTAVFAPSCPIASGLVTRLRNNDYEVPKNISVICFDDSMLIDERGLNLTTISYNPYQMGIYAAETLIRRIENRNGGCYRLLLEPKILDIHSVAPPLSQSDK